VENQGDVGSLGVHLEKRPNQRQPAELFRHLVISLDLLVLI
jgi:hypothetical protein